MAITDEDNNHSPANSSLTSSATRFTTLDHNHPLYLQPTDTPGSSLISLQLTGSDNYAIWSRSMRIDLLVRPGLMSSVVYASNAYKVWEDLKERFDKGTMIVADYFSKLRDLWDEFDALMPYLGIHVQNLRIPNINKAYSLLVDLESQMSLVNFTQLVQVAEVAEGSAMFSNKGPIATRGNSIPQKKIPQCEYCHCK
ncbi:uncharacterized protein [Nicotiana sylvestris]|uniref:uncharacterized protein n=1 Tax=Nicotiana sylvestris TaxID=4096 RepID=UPI00388CD144